MNDMFVINRTTCILGLAMLCIATNGYVQRRVIAQDQASCRDVPRAPDILPSSPTGILLLIINGLESDNGCLHVGLYTREHWKEGPRQGGA